MNGAGTALWVPAATAGSEPLQHLLAFIRPVLNRTTAMIAPSRSTPPAAQPMMMPNGTDRSIVKFETRCGRMERGESERRRSLVGEVILRGEGCTDWRA